MFQDEARFGRITTRSDCWAPEGVRPVVPQQAIREYTYAYAAVAPETGEVDSLILPDMTSLTLSVFLKELAARHLSKFILLVLDGAPCHHSKKEELVIPKNIRLLFLPPYSPELNPTENLWDEMREKHFSNHVFKDMNAVRKRMVEALLALEGDKTRVHSIAGFPWILAALKG